MFNLITENQLVSALLMTTLLGASLAYLRNVPTKLLSFIWSRFFIFAEIKSTDSSFSWLTMWLDKHPYSASAKHLSVFSMYLQEDFEKQPGDITKKTRVRPRILFTPSPGDHILWFKGRLVWFRRAIATTQSANSFNERESYQLWVFGRNQDVIREILNDALMLAMPDNIPDTHIYVAAEGRWQTPITRKRRLAGSVILADDLLTSLVTDARVFFKNREWYEDLGIPYRRGYLFYGIPGSGKTSAVLAMAAELGVDVYLLNLSDRAMDDGRLNALLCSVPPGNIVLLEDIDAAFIERKPTNAEKDDSKITFSGLLNAIDGVAAGHGRLLFMTTNHKELLDPALIRPGRADNHTEFSYATPLQAELMFKRFFPDDSHGYAQAFSYATPLGKISMAMIQDHLLLYRDNAQEACTKWGELHGNNPT